MIYLALLCLLAAAGLLAVAVVTGVSLWSWASFCASVAAAVLIALRWLLLGRAARRPMVLAGQKPDEDAEADEAIGELTNAAPRSGEADVEPGEEDTDATDLLVVSELTDEVLVVDERPRYHLRRCRWLAGKPTIPLGVDEARQLGFTPCARCTPDAVLARRHRAAGTRSGRS